MNVIVVDAKDVGWGASGRSGGQVNPMLPFNSPERIRQIVGDDKFEQVIDQAKDVFASVGFAAHVHEISTVNLLKENDRDSNFPRFEAIEDGSGAANVPRFSRCSGSIL